MGGRLNRNGFVLAGGGSTRMGRDKALLRLGNAPLILRAARLLEPLVDEVVCLAPPERYEGLWPLVIADCRPGQGPLAAVCTGLRHSPAEWNIFLACDIPLVSRGFLELLIRRLRASASDAVVPRDENGWQPFAAAYHARCREIFVGAFEKGERSLVRLLDTVNVEAITPEDMRAAGVHRAELTNVNTPGDWERVKRLFEERNPSC